MAVFTAPDGARLWFTDDGPRDGVPIVALAGLTRNATDFDYVAPHVADTRLIRMDYRGRGKSDFTGAETYTIPTEAADTVALLDHLGLERAAILGTSRGGLIAMTLAVTAKDRLSGVCLNDIGPVIAPEGLAGIAAFIGRPPEARSHAEARAGRAALFPGFENVPESRWAEEVRKHYVETPEGLAIPYDPALRAAFLAASDAPLPDLWPLFDALDGLPLALVRGANSNLLTADTAAEMRHRRPDMIFAEVPGRGHVPFLDEPQAVEAIRAWITRLT